MIIQLGILVLLGSMATTSALPPCVCTRNLAPVCGSDGRTYNNECLLRCAQLSDQDLIMESRGRCTAPAGGDCICTLEYNPVCGTDGRTYPNKCALGCAQRSASVEMAHEGDCRSKRETNDVDCICPLLYSPVCGSDGKTYPNECTLRCTQRSTAVKVDHMGACRTKRETVQVAGLPAPSCTCPRDYEPVCGTDGQTYPNECELNCDRAKKSDLRIEHQGACENDFDCICPLLYSPVCGSDGKTYPNKCTLRCTQRSAAVEEAHTGECTTKSETVQVAELPVHSCTCPRDYEPVCGSDGQTYPNECELNCDRAKKSDLRIEHQGACENEFDCICPLLYSPVCGTDGKTYSNQCSLGCAQRSIAVEVAHMGACMTKRETVQIADLPSPACTCPRDYEPVCGTDGQTYPNECELDCDRTKKSDLHLKHRGECEQDLCICTDELRPVCGSDDNTYGNPCVLRCESRRNPDLKLSHMGACKEKVKVVNPFPACVCTREMKPVCGTDGNTYSNPCLLNCARERDENLHIEHVGPCGSKLQIVEQADNSCTCTRNLLPVCASDGVTYSNACLMRCSGAHLTVVKDAPCEE